MLQARTGVTWRRLGRLHIAATQHIFIRNRTMEVNKMKRFLAWLDRLALASPLAAMQIFQL